MCGRAVPFRLELMESGAMPQLRGVAPGMIRGATSGGAEPPPHIGRHSREPEFPHSLFSQMLMRWLAKAMTGTGLSQILMRWLRRYKRRSCTDPSFISGRPPSLIISSAQRNDTELHETLTIQTPITQQSNSFVTLRSRVWLINIPPLQCAKMSGTTRPPFHFEDTFVGHLPLSGGSRHHGG